MRPYLVAGNWKMNGRRAANAELLKAIRAGVSEFGDVKFLICPPYPYLPSVTAALKGSSIAVGAQTVSEHEDGAYTGEVSCAMLDDLDCRYVIVGHSERRAMFGEDDATVAAKFKAAADAGLIPILCVGEVQSERESGDTERVVGRQLDAVLEAAGIARFRKAVIAYEPVWAIGTGLTASPEQAQAVHAFIRGRLADKHESVAREMQILYGGSVKGANAAGLFAMPDIDGGLIGGASLKAEEFIAIGAAAAAAA